MKSILLHVGDDAGFESRLQAALDLARFTGGHVEALQVRAVPPVLAGETMGFAGSAAAVVQLLEDDNRRAEIERQRLADRLGHEDVPTSFSEAMGDAGQAMVDRSLLADVLVMTRPTDGAREAARALAHAVTRADAPVLAIPSDWSRLETEKPMLVAWKPTAEAAAAVRAALPLLARASRVDVVSIDPQGLGDFPPLSVARYLARHDIKCELHERHKGSATTSDTLLAAAQELGAGLMVMGGYGRSRAMEFLMGGVTRRLLGAAPLPLLMAH